VLRFEAPDFQPLILETALRPADREVEVNAVLRRLGEALPAPPGPTPGNDRPIPVAAITLGGAGLIALGVSAYFGLAARAQYRDLKATCAPRCTHSDSDSVHTKAVIADVALLASAVALGAGAWLYFSRGPALPATVGLGIEPRLDGADLRARFTF
jgi:hypothetical protein